MNRDARRAEHALRESEERFRTLFEQAPVGISELSPSGRYRKVNRRLCEITGYSAEELQARTFRDITHPEDAGGDETHFAAMLSGKLPAYATEKRYIRKGGEVVWVAVTVAPVRDAGGTIRYFVAIAQESTERKRAELALARRERYFRKLVEGSSDAFVVANSAGELVYLSDSERLFSGYDTAELLGRNLMDLVLGESAAQVGRVIAEVAAHPRGQGQAEARIQRKDGSVLQVELGGRNLLADPDVNGIVVTAHDITERKRAETELRASEEKFRAIFERTADGILAMSGAPPRVEFANARLERMLGYGAGELAGLGTQELAAPEDAAAIAGQFERARAEPVIAQDLRLRRKDGQVVYADLASAPVEFGGERYLVGAFRDATERRAGEESLRKVNRALRTLSAGNAALVRATDEAGLLREMARILTGIGGYRIALVCRALDDEDKSLALAACEGLGPAELEAARCASWADTPRGQSAPGRAVRMGSTQVVLNPEFDPESTPWRREFRAKGIRASLGIPLRFAAAERPFGALGIATTEPKGFQDDELKLLEELAGDIAYGIANLRLQAEQRTAGEKLRRSLESTIGAISATMETRDPYTAGHQRRVAALAAAIAREMGLAAHAVEGIHFGALIHDLGKIQVPAEILAKPTRLSELEFELIKIHALAGYDIIKGVDFPWPVAQMVLQHHERIDGSGYPRGLSGEQMAPESRILAVADVVEAMSSHRPYRPGLGIDAALREIEEKRGKWFDPAAVDACLRLFREKAFAFDSPPGPS